MNGDVNSGCMVLIPAYNEAQSIAAVVAAVRALAVGPVVVIDDCSTDRTAELAQIAGAEVLRLPINLGSWGALQTGLRLAFRRCQTRVVTLDADGQHDPSQIPALLAPLARGHADLVIGACPARVSAARRLAWQYFRLLTGLAIEDITSGFRAYNEVAIRRLIKPDATLLDYQDVGVLLILRRQGLRIHEVAVAMRERVDGKSRIFDSWVMVGRYMLITSLLCLARIGYGKTRMR